MSQAKPKPELPEDWDDNPEWDDETLARARPAREWLTDRFGAEEAERMLAENKRAGTKEWIGIVLDADVVRRYQATGPGWSERISAVLRANLPDEAKP